MQNISGSFPAQLRGKNNYLDIITTSEVSIFNSIIFHFSDLHMSYHLTTCTSWFVILNSLRSVFYCESVSNFLCNISPFQVFSDSRCQFLSDSPCPFVSVSMLTPRAHWQKCLVTNDSYQCRNTTNVNAHFISTDGTKEILLYCKFWKYRTITWFCLGVPCKKSV